MPTDRPLSDSVALVTGASSGIGEAAARTLAGLGASVALAARRTDRLEALAGEIRDAGGTALPIEADVTDRGQAEAAVKKAVDELGSLDTLINNAGVMLLGPIEGAPTDEWRTMIDANVYGLIYSTHAALPIMREQGAGHIVNISSVAGRVARSGSGVYNLTKHGIGAFSESLRQEVTASGIRVTLIEPGAVETELVDQNRPEMQEQINKRFEGIERLQAEDIANAIVYTLAQPAHVSINEVLIRPTGQVG
jgi:NADP-dependent 3-hydroxy acid dehydrogenase YdfG